MVEQVNKCNTGVQEDQPQATDHTYPRNQHHVQLHSHILPTDDLRSPYIPTKRPRRYHGATARACITRHNICFLQTTRRLCWAPTELWLSAQGCRDGPQPLTCLQTRSCSKHYRIASTVRLISATLTALAWSVCRRAINACPIPIPFIHAWLLMLNDLRPPLCNEPCHWDSRHYP